MRESCKSSGGIQGARQRRGRGGGVGKSRPGSAGAMEMTELTSGTQLSEKRGEGGRLGKA